MAGRRLGTTICRTRDETPGSEAHTVVQEPTCDMNMYPVERMARHNYVLIRVRGNVFPSVF
eukprot:6643605-Prymnesium_polylepis.1